MSSIPQYNSSSSKNQSSTDPIEVGGAVPDFDESQWTHSNVLSHGQQQPSHTSHSSYASHGAQTSQQQQHESAIPTGTKIPPPIGESSSHYSSGPAPSKSELHQGANAHTSSNSASSHAAYGGSSAGVGSGLSSKNAASSSANPSGSTTTGSAAASALRSDADPNHPIHEAEDFLTELLTWKNPVYTGKVLGLTLGGLILFRTIDLVRIFFKISYITLLFSAGAEYIGKVFTGQGFVSNFYKNYSTSFAKPINKHLLPLIGELNVAIEHHLNYIVYARNVETTLKFAGISYIFYQLTSVVSLFTLTIVSVILLFAIPPAYLANKKQVDAFVGKYTACFKQQVGKGVDQIHDALKQTPVGPYLQKFAPRRTAGSTVGNSKATSYGTAADTQGVNVNIPVGSSTSSSTGTGDADLRERNIESSVKNAYY
ncbi:Rtn1 protein [Candida orthopsilosis Co 90-125]|uniref:Reticulon-like protein n=1 Tax=Candida orthopsilosis (strain 90-125) TaxID=1136231 RepID=H8X7B6_CANO9|nr:Rtn1 protein [Candida orthopsilosis Co 90-125]CCG24045.1 Rtn1 protein [Candida orthopsilosis Co 90-125]